MVLPFTRMKVSESGQKEYQDTIKMMLKAKVNVGDKNPSFGMSPYIYKIKKDGTCLINPVQTYEKIKLAARMICPVQARRPEDVLCVSNKPNIQRAVHKFASYTGATCINSRFTPGTFTNHSIEAKFSEPRLIIVCDPTFDKQAVSEAAYANIPCIALCDTNSPVRYVDCVIPCNLKNNYSAGLVLWILTREVLRLRGDIGFDVMPDAFFHRDQTDEKVAEREAKEEQPAEPAKTDSKIENGTWRNNE